MPAAKINILYDVIAIFHNLIWAFVLLGGFVNKQTATINVYLIAAMYVLHAVLSFHILETVKKMVTSDLDDEGRNEMKKSFQDRYLIFSWFTHVQKYLEKRCFMSPFTPQGMMIFGLLSSIYTLMRK